MKFIELFAGIGGFRYGLENIKTTQGKPAFSCVYANEFNKYAVQIYERNFNEQNKSSRKCREWTRSTERLRPDRDSTDSQGESREGYKGIDTRDIREVKAEEIPNHELLTAGFPCQAFSIAGKRRGFEDTRGTLFFEVAKILQQKQPPYCLLENVRGLLSHENGRTFQTILTTLDELGYDAQWQVLNSKNFGVPQNRERVFIIGHLRGTSRPEVFPIGGADTKDIKESKGEQIAITRGRSTERQGDKADVRAIDGMKIRRLTPTECERLQGFPDGWTKYGINENGEQVEISDTQRYKALGNAVTTNVVTAIGNRLLTTKEGKE